MAYGIGIHNANGNVIIDGERQNYFLVERRSVSMTYNTMAQLWTENPEIVFPRPVYFSRVIDSDVPPYVALRHTGGRPVGVCKMNGRPGNWYGFDVCTNAAFQGGSRPSNSFEYEVYITSNEALAKSQQAGFFFDTGYGMTVDDAEGRRVFDTRMVNLAIIDAPVVSLYGIGNMTSSQRSDYEGTVIRTLPQSSMVSAFAVMGAYGYYWGMKPMLEGDQIILRHVVQSRQLEYYAPVTAHFYGSHAQDPLPLMISRRQVF